MLAKRFIRLLLKRNSGLSSCYSQQHPTNHQSTTTTPTSSIPSAPLTSIPDFGDSRACLSHHSFLQLLRAWFIYRLCSWEFLVDRQAEILRRCQKVLGKRLFSGVMRRTVYRQFMAGETNAQVLSVAKHHTDNGLVPMFSYTSAELHGKDGDKADTAAVDRMTRKNYEALLNAVDIASQANEGSIGRCRIGTKLTYMLDPQILKRASEIFDGNAALVDRILHLMGPHQAELMEELSDFTHTAGAADIGFQPAHPESIQHLHLNALKTNVTWNIQLRKAVSMSETLKELDHLRGATLSPDEEDKLKQLWERMVSLGQKAKDQDVIISWDAEQTYFKAIIESLIMDTMRKFNTEKPVTGTTYQCYLQRAKDTAERDIRITQHEGFCLNAKVVRGAYIDEERRLARELGHADPVNPDYEATTRMYESVADLCLREMKKHQRGKISLIFATHNAESVKYVIRRMEDLGIDHHPESVAFAQLLGMRDYITFPLAHAGIPASKLINYGPVGEGITYLSRRLQENKATVPTADEERRMVGEELTRRLFFWRK